MKKRYFIFSFLFFVFFLNTCSKQQQTILPQISSDGISTLSPEQVVILYFQAWNNKQYDVMYSLISDVFKQIEPTAKTFNDFRSYMEKFYDTASNIKLIDAQEEYKNDNEAGISYKIEIENKDGTKKDFSSTYTLKRRANGWKLIHPYGNNIDTT